MKKNLVSFLCFFGIYLLINSLFAANRTIEANLFLTTVMAIAATLLRRPFAEFITYGLNFVSMSIRLRFSNRMM